MRRVRYVAWDGSRPLRLDPEAIFEEFARALSETDDAAAALESLLRDGLEIDGLHVLGVDELREELAARRRELEQGVNLDRALDELRERFEEALERERNAMDADSSMDEAHRRERQALLEDLGARLSTAIERALGRHEFSDPEAARSLEELAGELDSIRRIEEAQRRLGRRLRGENSLDYQQALEFLDQLEALEKLDSELAAGNLSGIDPSELGSILGDAAQAGLEALQGMVVVLMDAGYLQEREGAVALSPRAIRKIGQIALRDIYEALLRDSKGAHAMRERGGGEPTPDRIRDWEFGDALDLALVPTLMEAVRRAPKPPLSLVAGDFQVREADHATTASTVLLLDMSWSMSWEGRFVAAKKVALALESLIRTRFPRDYFGIVGFYTRAVELTPRTLPEATWSMGDPFTNLQDGLRMAGRLLRRHPSRNQQVIVITDGQPTAYWADGRLHCEWPLSFGGVSRQAAEVTLREVKRITQQGVTINTFMLDDAPALHAFVERMTQINKGRALYTRPDRLGSYLLVDYFGRKKRHLRG